MTYKYFYFLDLQAGAIAGLTPVFIQTQGIGGPAVAAAIPPHMEQMGYHSPNYGGNQSPHREEGGGFHERDFDYHRSMLDSLIVLLFVSSGFLRSFFFTTFYQLLSLAQ